MSKSLKRVVAVIKAAGIESEALEMPSETRTAADAAREAGCDLDQIAKSIIFQGQTTGDILLFITAGGNRVDPAKASEVAGEALGRANANVVRKKTGFAIGGVAPVGHLTPPRAFFDPRLMDFEWVYGAAGTPRHILPLTPQDLLRVSGAEMADFIE